MTSNPPLDCAICLQTCYHPVRLPCSHIFCFLCIKGATNQHMRCAMCRHRIPDNYFDEPDLLSETKADSDLAMCNDGFQWLYEGRNGWWIYEKRAGDEIEEAFSRGEKRIEQLIAGFLYVIDFEKMIQFRRNEPNRLRRIKRDNLNGVIRKGIAGIRQRHLNEQIHPTVDTSQMQYANHGTSLSASDNRSSSVSSNHIDTQASIASAPSIHEIEDLIGQIDVSLINESHHETYL